MKNYLAKSDGTTLISHSVEAMKNAEQICEQLNINDANLRHQAMFAALFHDLGKATESFQEYLADENVKVDVPHNYVSGYFLKNYLETMDDTVLKAIWFHHPLYSNSDNVRNYMMTDEDIISLKEMADALLEEFTNYTHTTLYKAKTECSDNYIDLDKYPYFERDSKGNNPQFLLLVNIVRMSDIIASSTTDFPFNNIYPNSLEIIKPAEYDEIRFNYQKQLASECFDCKDSLINAITGFGKTMVGLLYLLKSEHKSYWVCPRNEIAQGVYKNILGELKALGLQDTVSVSLLLSGKYEHGDEDSRIVVTNIDNFFNPNTSTRYNERCIDMFKSNVVFDEFHEYLSEEAIMAGFMTILHSRNLCQNAKTLYMSATPIPNLYDIYGDTNEINVKVFPKDDTPLFGEDKKVKITFGSEFKGAFKGSNHLVSVPTVKSAQLIYNKSKTDQCYHAQFTRADRENKIQELYDTHGKGCNVQNSYVSTNALSTGLNVSFDNMTIITPTPERLLQVGGRVNRYGTNDLSEYVILDEKVLKKDFKSDKCFLEKTHPLKGVSVLPLINAWLEYLKAYVDAHSEDGTLYLKDLYNAREEFYASEGGKRIFGRYFERIQLASFNNLSQITYTYSGKRLEDDDSKTIVNKPSLRASNDAIFIKVYDMNTKKLIDEPIQFTIGTFGVDKYDLQDVLDGMVRYVESLPSTDNPYFKSKYVWENMSKKGNAKIFEYFLEKAKNSSTPFIVTQVLSYTKNLGLFGTKK